MVEGNGFIVDVINDANFDNYLHEQKKNNRLFIIDFWAVWCNPCKIFSPTFNEVASEYNKVVQFGKCNVDENPLIVKKYNIRSVPTLLLFKNCEMINTKIGLLSKKELYEFLDANKLK